MNDLTMGTALVPRTIAEAIEFSKLLAKSELVPKDYREKPANILVAIQAGFEVGLLPMQSIQSFAVINGRPTMWGDAGKALLLSRGFKIEQDDFEKIRKESLSRCTITRPDGQVCTRTFGIEDAKRAHLWGKQGPWTEYPERQMSWRAFWFAARDIAADVLRGVGGAEERLDMPAERDVTGEGEVVEMPSSLSEKERGPVIAEQGVDAPAGEQQATGQAQAEEKAPAAQASALTGKPLQEGQLKVIRAKLKNAALTEKDLVARFGELEGLRFEQFTDIQNWIAEKAAATTR